MLFRGHGLLFGGALLLVACGSSRPTQKLCSKTNAVYDGGSAGQQAGMKAGETRDPAAAILLFKATSNKITIESRCNARLMHKLDVTTKDGREPPRPIDFNNLKFQIENNTETMELHSSNHCFFRIWDPRDKNQFENNESLRKEPAKSILSNPLERYHLYKSLLTSPQKLIMFASNGAPVEFEYKFSGQEIYSQFFKKVDALQADTYRFVVGREFSKTSVILDELALDVCGAPEKLLQRLDESTSNARESVTDLVSFARFYQGQSGYMKEPFRRSLLSSGRNKTCISQTDFVVVPIKFTGELSAAQKALTTEIFTKQTTDASNLLMKMEKVFRSPSMSIGELISELTPDMKYSELEQLQEPARSQFVADKLKLPSTCTPWLTQYPGLMTTAPMNAFSAARMARFDFRPEHHAGVEDVTRKLFPKIALTGGQGSFAPAVAEILKPILQETECKMRGFNFEQIDGSESVCLDGTPMINGNRKLEIDSEMGACPPEGEAYRIYAAKAHLNVVSSIRMAMASTIMNLEKYRQNHKQSLLLPLAQLRDGTTTDGTTNTELARRSTQNDRSVFIRMGKILDSMESEYADVTKFYDSLTVDSISPDLELRCSLTTASKNRDNPGAVDVSAVYDTLSNSAKVLVNAGFPRADSYKYYLNFAARYLMIRCINATSPLMFTGYSKAAGIFQFLRDTNVSFIASDTIPESADSRLPNLPSKTLIETGRPVQLSLQKFIAPSNAQYQHEITSYLTAEGHVEVSYCQRQSVKRTAELNEYCQLKLLNREFLTHYKNRYPSEFAPSTGRLAMFDPAGPLFNDLVTQEMVGETPTPRVFAKALPSIFAHLNVLTTIPRWYPQRLKDSLGRRAYPNDGFNESSGMYALGPGDSGTTISLFGLFPTFMVSAVNDQPVSGGLAVIPSTGGQVVQPRSSGACR
jgi:hypothetical protein